MQLRFLAATQFYKGGDYQRALEITKKIEARLLPQGVRHLFLPFLRDVKARAANGYAAGIEQALSKAWLGGDHQRVLDLLKDHPYVLKPGEMAFVRAVVCEELGEWRVAALFYESAIKHSPDDLGVIFSSAFGPLRLLSQNRLLEASESIHRRVELYPHLVILITAEAIAYQQALSGGPSLQPEGFEKQFRYLDKAWEAYQQLPEAQRTDAHLRRYMAFGLAVGAMAAIRLRDKNRAEEVLERIGQFGTVAGSTQRTIEHLRNFLEADKSPWDSDGELADAPAVKNLSDTAAFLKSQRDSTMQRFLPPVAA